MKINITDLYRQITKENAPMDFSASIAEIGWNAGQQTWLAAQELAEDVTFNGEDIAELRGYFDGFGAWEDIYDMPDPEVVALFVQEVSSRIREESDQIYIDSVYFHG